MVIVHRDLLNHPSDQGFAVLGNFFRLTLKESNHVSHTLANTVLVGFLQEQFFLFRSEFIDLIGNGSQNGFINVLSSLSPNPQIRRIKNLYKVGYCSGDITDRIKNAKNEPTYLMSDVHVELAVRCFNLNVPNLESTIHSFFKDVNCSFEVYDDQGNKHYPREWFVAPLEIIEETIQLIVDGKIENYRYDTVLQQLVMLQTDAEQ